MGKEYSIGETIKTLRKHYGLSQKALADAIHVSQPAVNRWEADLRAPSFVAAVRMASFFDVGISAFVKEEALANNAEDDLRAEDDPAYTKRAEALKRLTKDIQQLNISGINEADKHVQLLARIPEYQRKNETLEN